MSDVSYTVDLMDTQPAGNSPSTGFRNDSFKSQTLNIWSIPRIAKIAGLAISLVASPVTAIPDIWLLERRRRDSAVTMGIFQEVIGRAISRSEALLIARQILEQAERERLSFAEFEAVRGIQWRDEA